MENNIRQKNKVFHITDSSTQTKILHTTSTTSQIVATHRMYCLKEDNDYTYIIEFPPIAFSYRFLQNTFTKYLAKFQFYGML